MKTIVETKDAEGFEAFLGEKVSIWCLNYIYTGRLVGVNATCVKLADASIVYETGAFTDTGWKDAQSVPWKTHYVQISAVESFGGVK